MCPPSIHQLTGSWDFKGHARYAFQILREHTWLKKKNRRKKRNLSCACTPSITRKQKRLYMFPDLELFLQPSFASQSQHRETLEQCLWYFSWAVKSFILWKFSFLWNDWYLRSDILKSYNLDLHLCYHT